MSMTDLSDREITAQLRDWADDLAATVAPFEPAPSVLPPSTYTTRRPRLRRRVLLAAAVVVLIAATIAVRYQLHGSSTAVTATGSGYVLYERVQYHQSEDLACPGSVRNGRYDDATFETWGDQTRKRWRTRVTYPDGTTSDVIAFDSPWYPTELYERGNTLGASYDCPGIGTLVIGSGHGSIYSLNPLAPLPSFNDIPGSQPVQHPPGYPSPVLTYRELGQQVAGDHIDSQGRSAQLWRQTITGYGGNDNRPLTQTTDWYVDAATGRVLEETFTDDVTNYAVAHSTWTLVTSGTTTVPDNFFDIEGFNRSR